MYKNYLFASWAFSSIVPGARKLLKLQYKLSCSLQSSSELPEMKMNHLTYFSLQITGACWKHFFSKIKLKWLMENIFSVCSLFFPANNSQWFFLKPEIKKWQMFTKHQITVFFCLFITIGQCLASVCKMWMSPKALLI